MLKIDGALEESPFLCDRWDVHIVIFFCMQVNITLGTVVFWSFSSYQKEEISNQVIIRNVNQGDIAYYNM